MRASSAQNRRLRVLQVVDSLEPGGAERHVVDLAAELARRGHEVAVASSVGGVLAAELEQHGVPVFPLMPALVKRRVSPDYAAALRQVLTAGGYDVVHGHMFASSVAAARATSGQPSALVVTEHTQAPWRSREAHRVSHCVYQQADRLLAVSSVIGEELRSCGGVPRGRVSVVPPAITPSSVQPAPRPPSWQGSPVIGRVCRLQPEKGVEVFLQAAALVCERRPQARFVVIGDGPLRPELEALAGESGPAGQIEILGFRPDARELIGAMDVLAVSSRSDGTPLVVFEALSAGVPVVASRVGGIPDQIRDGREGLLVPPDDAAALAGALARVIDDRALAARLGREARARAASFPYSGMVDSVESAYRAAVVTASGRLTPTAAPA